MLYTGQAARMLTVYDGRSGADTGGEDGEGEVVAKIDIFCVKVAIMGRNCSSVEGK
jgi:hypothetical protein